MESHLFLTSIVAYNLLYFNLLYFKVSEHGHSSTTIENNCNQNYD
jgi:hypothetical protein